MGRKVHPMGFRLGIIRDWQSRWYADREYTVMLHEDVKIRSMVSQRLTGAGLARIEIQRSANQLEVTLHTAKPGIVIGKGGQQVDQLRRDLEAATGKKVKLNIEEIKQPELNAFLIGDSIAEQLSRRVSYRRAMKQAVLRAMRAGAKGVRVRISGRLGGAEMARSVWEMEGRVPLHTIRADIDYAQVHAHTTYGRVGVKVWLYKGDVIERKGDNLLDMERPVAVAQPRPERRERRERREPAGRPEGRAEGRPEGRPPARSPRPDQALGRAPAQQRQAPPSPQSSPATSTVPAGALESAEAQNHVAERQPEPETQAPPQSQVQMNDSLAPESQAAEHKAADTE